ncbi:hypothetical protein J1614_007790 [Plenodomus biglobosus]|nr:hypothetical protein J1614_007790 [Plenodomus biglobosus]
MADNGAALASELTSIIDCPYPASLSGLARVLAHSDIPSIRTCIADRSQCATQKLVSIVYDALPLSSYTLRVLHQLCHAPEFRDQLLLLKPGLLNALLTKANSSQQDFDDYADTCVLILSHQLPIPLPSSAQEFFLRIFQKSTQNPCVETLKPIYCMLNGACHQLFALLPRDAQQQFDQQLRHILKSSDVGKDAMLLLWCFGIVLLIEYPEASSTRPTRRPDHVVSILGAKKDWKTASGQKLFLGSMSLYRTITLASLSVVWAIKGGVGVSNDEAIQGIRIASRVLRVIDQEVRENWPKSDARARGTYLKLVEKIERLDTKSTIFFEAAGFHALIIGTNGLQSESVAQYELCLVHTICAAHEEVLEESLLESLPAFADHLRPTTIQTIYTHVLETCMSKSSIHQSGLLAALMDTLTTAMCTSETLRHNALCALTLNDTQEKLQMFLEISIDHQKKPCSTYAASQHQKLLSATIATLLMTTATAHTGEPALPPTFVMTLIEKQRKLPSDIGSCSHSIPPVDRSPISLFQQASTPYTGQHLQDWRTRLNSELESQNHYQRDIILRTVAQICQDLESRCSTVEEPLRMEQEKSRGLQEKVAELSKQVLMLQSRISDDELHLQGLDDEKELLEQEKREMNDANKQLIVRIDSLKNEYVKANEKAEETIRNMQKIQSTRELEWQSTILEHEEEQRAWTVQRQELDGTINRMKITQEEKEGALHTLNGQCVQLQNRLGDAEKQLQTERTMRSRQAEEITRLQTRNFDMETQLRGTEEELELAVSKLSDLQVSHQELKKSSEEELKKIEIEHNNSMEDATARAEGEQNKLYTQLQTVQQENLRLQGAYDDTRRECQLLQASISSLETRREELTELCSEQEEELYELRTLRRNVLASMGLGTQNPLAIRSSSRSQEANIDPQTPYRLQQPPHRKLASPSQSTVPKAAPGAQGVRDVAVGAMTDDAFALPDGHSSRDGERNPKRSKPRPQFKVPAMYTPLAQKPSSTFKSVSKRISPTKRSVLRQLSPNRQHTTAGFAVAEKPEGQGDEDRPIKARRGSLEDFEQVDFDMEEDFVGGTPLTPGNFLAGTGLVPDDDPNTTQL